MKGRPCPLPASHLVLLMFNPACLYSSGFEAEHCWQHFLQWQEGSRMVCLVVVGADMNIML